MNRPEIVAAIDKEIERLQQAKAILEGVGTRGGKSIIEPPSAAHAKRTVSPEARAKIAEAQRKRWAARKKATK